MNPSLLNVDLVLCLTRPVIKLSVCWRVNVVEGFPQHGLHAGMLHTCMQPMLCVLTGRSGMLHDRLEEARLFWAYPFTGRNSIESEPIQISGFEVGGRWRTGRRSHPISLVAKIETRKC